jgi:pimeloyl-ACP methyl ester carboxylesterase
VNIIVNELLVNYSRQGKGVPLLFLHGWGDQLGTFDDIVAKLEKDNTIIRLDLPGFGKSQAPTSAWGLKQYAEHVEAFLRKIDCNPEVIVGHSNGGAIAIYGLANGQLKASKLVLLSSAGIRSIKKGRKFAWKVLAKAGKAATSILPSDTRDSLRRRLYQSSGSDLLVAPGMEATFKRIVSEDVQSEAAMLRLPTLIMNGREDTATPPEFAELFHRDIADSKLVLVDDAGHFLHQQYPDKVSTEIKSFLAS